MDEILKNMGRAIRQYRIREGITQQELAERSELSLPFINLIENNHRKMTLETLIKILKALNVSPSEFFRPYSDVSDLSTDEQLISIISKVQSSKQKEKYIQLFNDILLLSDENL